MKEKQIVKLQVRALHIGKCPPHGHNFIRICGVRELQGTKVPWVRMFQGAKVPGIKSFREQCSACGLFAEKYLEQKVQVPRYHASLA